MFCTLLHQICSLLDCHQQWLKINRCWLAENTTCRLFFVFCYHPARYNVLISALKRCWHGNSFGQARCFHFASSLFFSSKASFSLHIWLDWTRCSFFSSISLLRFLTADCTRIKYFITFVVRFYLLTRQQWNVHNLYRVFLLSLTLTLMHHMLYKVKVSAHLSTGIITEENIHENPSCG